MFQLVCGSSRLVYVSGGRRGREGGKEGDREGRKKGEEREGRKERKEGSELHQYHPVQE